MIKKEPSDHTTFRHNQIYSKSARTGFLHLLEWFGFERPEIILLPSYIGISVREGSGVLDPVCESGIGYDFYKVNEDLSAEVSDLEEKIQSNNVKIIFLIHFFGIIQSDIKYIRDLCSENSIILIEDCAHCLTSGFGQNGIGNIGDFSIFSIHKVLPVKEGGILKINNSAKLPPIREENRIPKEPLEIYSMACFEDISAIRIRNYKMLSDYLSPIKGIARLYPEIDHEIVPLNFPILIKEKDRFEIYNLLRERGVEAIALYYELVSEIKIEDYPVSQEISTRILNLPIHQEISEHDLITIAETLEDVLSL